MLITGGCKSGKRRDTKYFYHVARWFDMDNDGDLDLLTTRAESLYNPVEVTSSQLVWFENPGDQKFLAGNNPWKSWVIEAGNDLADTYLDVHQANGEIYVVAGGFSSKRLVVYQGAGLDWRETTNVKATVYDNDGFYFAQSFEDLDLDGVPDVIATIGSYPKFKISNSFNFSLV